MNNKVLLTAALMAVFVVGTFGASSIAFAQYLGNVGEGGETGKFTLEEALALQRSRVDSVMENPEAGSGTPYLDASGVGGAAVISAVIFGGIAGAFFFKGRSGKYAAMGRG